MTSGRWNWPDVIALAIAIAMLVLGFVFVAEGHIGTGLVVGLLGVGTLSSFFRRGQSDVGSVPTRSLYVQGIGWIIAGVLIIGAGVASVLGFGDAGAALGVIGLFAGIIGIYIGVILFRSARRGTDLQRT